MALCTTLIVIVVKSVASLAEATAVSSYGLPRAPDVTPTRQQKCCSPYHRAWHTFKTLETATVIVFRQLTQLRTILLRTPTV